MNVVNQPIVKHKLGLLNLAEELGNVSQACKIMGVSRDTFYRYQEAKSTGGVAALLHKDRRRPNLKNRVDDVVESTVIAYAIEQPAHGQVRVSNFDGKVDARSGEGRVYLGGHFTKVSAQTNNQPIVLTLSPDTNAIIETDSESITNEGVETTEETGPSQRPRRFKVGRGGPLFTLRSGSGRIILRRADSGPM